MADLLKNIRKDMSLIFSYDTTYILYLLLYKARYSNHHAPYFLSFQRLFYFLYLTFQIVLPFIQIIAIFTKIFYAFQLHSHFLIRYIKARDDELTQV